MTRTLDTATAARLAGTTVRTIRTWCRRGAVAAAKFGRRWIVQLGSLLHHLNAARPAVADRLRPGVLVRVPTGRAGHRYEARHAARAEAKHRRTRAASPRPGARPATHVQWALCLASTGTTARDYLFSLGCDEQFVTRYEAAFGRACAKVFREAHGCDPERTARVLLRGRVWSVFAYDEKGLYAGALAYPRTATLLAGRRESVLRELSAA